MNVTEALELVVSEMWTGPRYAYETKEEIKQEIYLKTGHYPRATEFDKALNTLLKNNNKYNFGFIHGTGWFRSRVKSRFIQKYNSIIRSCEMKKSAINI